MDVNIKHHILGDGNCLFRCFSFVIYDNENQHRNIRLKIVDNVIKNWNFYKNFMTDLKPEEYEKKMSMNSVYGGETEIYSFHDLYSVNIIIYIQITQNVVEYIRQSNNVTAKFYLSGNIDIGHYDVIDVLRNKGVHVPNNENNERKFKFIDHKIVMLDKIHNGKKFNKNSYQIAKLNNNRNSIKSNIEKKKLKLIQENNNINLNIKEQRIILKYVKKYEYDKNYGSMNYICEFCKAAYWKQEYFKKSCCHNNKIKLNKLSIYSKKLRNLIWNNRKFRQNIRYYNNLFSFATFSAKTIKYDSKGVYNLRIQGHVFHKTPTTIRNIKNNPICGQIYIYDDHEATSIRMNKNNNLDINFMYLITEIMKKNPYAEKYKTLYNLTKNVEVDNYKLIFERKRGNKNKLYEKPLTAECALILATNDGNVPKNIDLCVYPKQIPIGKNDIEVLNLLSQHIDPMIFPLLFPKGDLGWTVNNNFEDSNNITPNQYYSYRLAYRPYLGFDQILMSGRLSQQYVIHAFLRVEYNRLNFLRHNQDQLRIECYQGLYDHVQNSKNNISTNFINKEKVGNIFILPSTYIGSPRYMQQNYQDAMAIVRKIGRPDLFITMTFNPNWSEIIEVLKNFPMGTTCNDIPNITCRLFHTKFRSLISYICNKKIFGDIKAYVYTVEFQKRGLPHAHILFTLNDNNKLRNPESIDDYISAEIPDNDVILQKLVMKHMIHGPHTEKSPCYIENSKFCSKKFPKPFNNKTKFENNGYPNYKRRNNIDKDYKYNKQINGQNVHLNNSMVVPYSPILLKHYECHINVEYCAHISGMKYIFKYLTKGPDRAFLKLQNENDEQVTDELKQYIDARYVSPAEAAWRLEEFSICGRSHAVVRLQVHTKNQQYLIFKDNNKTQALNNIDTTLTAWFKLNKKNKLAKSLNYIDIPTYFSYSKVTKQWTERIKYQNTIGRMCSISPKDSERFHLKLILSRIKGATCFEDLKFFNNTFYPTYQETAIAMGLVESDDQIIKIFDEACNIMMPKQLRKFFAQFLLVDNIQALSIWEKYKIFFCEDFQYNPFDHGLNEIEQILQVENKKLSDYCLPTPNIKNIKSETNSLFQQLQNESIKINEEMKKKLNMDQLLIYKKIISSNEKLYFIDGPGGSGKTYLYTTLIHYFISQKKTVLSMAWTGIASLLLPFGMTVHRTFKLPRNFNNIFTCQIKQEVEKRRLQKADVIFIDEGSMLPKKALHIINQTLCDLCNTSKNFGGKMLIIGGDFRQILPVIKFASRATIITETIKYSDLWDDFVKLKLSHNVRSIDKIFSDFLLDVGNGKILSLDISPWRVSDVSKKIFSDINHNANVHNSVILTSHNVDVNKINNTILNYIDEEQKTYYSTDFVRYKGTDQSDEPIELSYDIDYLNKLNIPGLPVHELKLKINAIVMLIRNLSISDGLCNGTRLKIKKLHQHNIEAEIITGVKTNTIVFLPRILLDSGEDSSLPFILYRRQFPIILAFAMSINKSQGQSFDKVGIFLNKPLFSHGQLYVALSRCKNSKYLYIQYESKTAIVKNIVWNEVIE